MKKLSHRWTNLESQWWKDWWHRTKLEWSSTSWEGDIKNVLNLKEFSKQDLGVRCFLLDSLICLYKPFCTSESNAWYGEIINTWVICSANRCRRNLCAERLKQLVKWINESCWSCYAWSWCSSCDVDVPWSCRISLPRSNSEPHDGTIYIASKYTINTHWVPGFTTLKPAQRRDKAVSNCDEANGSE